MSCLFTCLLYSFLAIFGIGVLAKIYLVLTMGKHKIKQSLKGKVVVITGGSAGIGKATVTELATHGATIHVLSRDLQKAERVIGEIKQSTGNQNIHIHYVDLCNFSTVREFAKKFLDTGSRIHILINNAGLANSHKIMTVDGIEETTQANHLSHFLLTNLLLDRIVESAPARIVNVSSMVHAFVSAKVFDAYDLSYQKQSNQWGGCKAYCWTKLMNILFTRELAHRLHGKDVTVNSLHPGAVRTEITRSGKTWANPIVYAVWASFYSLPFLKTPLEGAQTTLYLATADEVEHVSGHYFSDCKISAISLLAADDRLALELWKESERLTGLAKA